VAGDAGLAVAAGYTVVRSHLTPSKVESRVGRPLEGPDDDVEIELRQASGLRAGHNDRRSDRRSPRPSTASDSTP